MIDHYGWPGGREAVLRFGPDHGPVAIVALPLFEEANRTRRLAVQLLHRLAARGIGGLLPDVPGQGESVAPLGTLAGMTDALAALSERCRAEGRATYGVGIRSGALLDADARHRGRWHLAPQTGADLLRDLYRIWLAAGRTGSVEAMLDGDDDTIEIAGNMIPVDLLRALRSAAPGDEAGISRRIVRLASDPRAADRHVEGPPLWRRSEPGEDAALAAMLADDIAGWVVACEG